MGTTKIFEAATRTELKQQVKAWEREVRGAGLEVVLGYGPERIENTDFGYSILVRAHT